VAAICCEDGPRNRHLPQPHHFQPGQLGLRQQRMQRTSASNFTAFGPNSLSTSRRERALIFSSDAHVQIAAHLREFFRELPWRLRRGSLLQQVARTEAYAVFLRCLIYGARPAPPGAPSLRQRPIRHQRQPFHSVRKCVRLVRRQRECLRRTAGGGGLLLRKCGTANKLIIPRTSATYASYAIHLSSAPFYWFPRWRCCGGGACGFSTIHRAIARPQIFLRRF